MEEKFLNNLFEKQNESRYLAMLAAQRYLYSSGKRVVSYFLLLSVVFGFVCFQWMYNSPGRWIWGVLWVNIISAVGVMVFSLWKSRKGAYIQEVFDTELYGIPWGEGGKNGKVTDEYIQKIAVKQTNTDRLKDWYGDYRKETPHLAILKCQMENLYWDSAQRRRYTVFLVGVIGVGVFLLMGRQLYQPSPIGWEMFIPLAGLLLYALFVIVNNGYTHLKLKQKYYDLKYFTTYEQDTFTGNWTEKHREIQDFIYKNRRWSPLVPDWFYEWFKKGIHYKVYAFDSGNGQILIETREWSWFPKRRLEKAAKNFDSAFASIDDLSKGLVKKLETADAQEVTLEMSVKVSGDIGAYIAKANSEGQLKVTVKWAKNSKLTN
jgi:hypothetical protein